VRGRARSASGTPPREVPRDRESESTASFEDDSVALAHLDAGEHAPERIVDVRVCAGLVQQHAAPLEGGDDFRETLEPVVRCRRREIVLPERPVPYESEREAPQDVVGAVAVVHVAVEDADVAIGVRGADRPRRDDQPVEGTEPDAA
jgi:hypothetical protein